VKEYAQGEQYGKNKVREAKKTECVGRLAGIKSRVTSLRKDCRFVEHLRGNDEHDDEKAYPEKLTEARISARGQIECELPRFSEEEEVSSKETRDGYTPENKKVRLNGTGCVERNTKVKVVDPIILQKEPEDRSTEIKNKGGEKEKPDEIGYPGPGQPYGNGTGEGDGKQDDRQSIGAKPGKP
jgi:hypothetical protein